jgi:tRNA threonylcarbamoyladenosine biosynthesis protein TsaE
MSFLSSNPNQTRQHARSFAAQCHAGDVIRLHGTLGAGKTTWVQGFISGLGCQAEATSPTFALLHEYTGGHLDVYHWDLYRLEPASDWSVLDLTDHLSSEAITLVEWPERYPGPWPTSNLWDISIEALSETVRSIETLPYNQKSGIRNFSHDPLS